MDAKNLQYLHRLENPDAVRIICLFVGGDAETYCIKHWPSAFYLKGLTHGRDVHEIRVEAIFRQNPA